MHTSTRTVILTCSRIPTHYHQSQHSFVTAPMHQCRNGTTSPPPRQILSGSYLSRFRTWLVICFQFCRNLEGLSMTARVECGGWVNSSICVILVRILGTMRKNLSGGVCLTDLLGGITDSREIGTRRRLMSSRPFMLMNLVVKFAVLFAHLLLFISRSDRIFLDIAFASCFLYCSLSMHDLFLDWCPMSIHHAYCNNYMSQLLMSPVLNSIRIRNFARQRQANVHLC